MIILQEIRNISKHRELINLSILLSKVCYYSRLGPLSALEKLQEFFLSQIVYLFLMMRFLHCIHLYHYDFHQLPTVGNISGRSAASFTSSTLRGCRCFNRLILAAEVRWEVRYVITNIYQQNNTKSINIIGEKIIVIHIPMLDYSIQETDTWITVVWNEKYKNVNQKNSLP